MSFLIRNFCIIAHVDHGKSTLADRFLELTKTIPQNKMQPQYLDRMPLERERGITIKLQPVTMEYASKGVSYMLNLIDTPGHVDFSYEVSRSLAAVEGAILLVDAGQGVQAQTLANLYLARQQDLAVIPVINKIDLPNIDLETSKRDLSNLLKISPEEIILTSAKTGVGVEKILEEVVKKVPPPQGNPYQPLRALIFDSVYDEYRGVIIFVRVFDGQIKAGEKIKMLANAAEAEVLEVGIFAPELKKQDNLSVGQIGYIVTSLKEIDKTRVGDTVTDLKFSTLPEILAGYQEARPMVFAGLYPQQGAYINKLRAALQKLKLNDASLFFEPERSSALGFGFRAGFLGLLHLDIIKERLKREFNIDLVITTPSVAYQIIYKNGEEETMHRAQEMPDPSQVEKILEPWAKVEILSPTKHVGAIMELVNEYKGRFVSIEYLGDPSVDGPVNGPTGGQRALIHYHIPFALLLADFYDKLKSVSSGYASMSYDFLDYESADVIKLDILVAEEPVEAFASIVYRDDAYFHGRRIVEKLKKVLPKQMFEVKIQAALGGKIVAAERLPAIRKDVTAKLYGGDVTRKMKLLNKQKKGKKKMMQRGVGKVDIPPEAYLAVLKK
ncbi:MAG: translation elongation factor 4 [Patescibacteria group bacterium]|nr:translation elongation factor 4 [Patescibacteria group bacterium]MDD5121081.1 translation elongation factor 4 [Patescibacteria group bacterium]MDD5221989.1 translation elongation factor 4 [Patescibacteria group bacterium]MDD5396000.1 translation elongation factor 4 [Patescibacteria group bacterium]